MSLDFKQAPKDVRFGSMTVSIVDPTGNVLSVIRKSDGKQITRQLD